MSLFSWFKAGDPYAKDRERLEKLTASQDFLIEAAVAITDVANALTDQIRRRYDADLVTASTSNIIEDALLICDADGIIRHSNPSAARDFGRQLTGTLITDYFQSDVTIESPAHLFEMMQETSIRLLGCNRLDGSSFVICPKVDRLDWEDKSVSTMIMIRREGVKTMTDMSFDAILVVRDDHIVAANPSVQRLFGYEVSSLLGQPLTNLFPKEKPERIAKEGEALIVVGTHDDGRALSLKFAAVHLLCDGLTARLVTVRNAEEIEDVRYDLKTDNGVDMIVCFNKDCKITFANSTFARVYNRDRQDLVGSNMSTILSAPDLEILKLNMDELSKDNPMIRVQVKHVLDDKSTTIHDWIWHVILDTDGKVVEYQRTGRDISSVVANIVTAGYF